MADPIRVAVVGTGYWGVNHVRVFENDADAELVAVCDPAAKALARARRLAPRAAHIERFADVLANDRVDAVVLATPAVTHADLACQALAAGKHVLVEKPLALTAADGQRVADAARDAQRTLMIGHLMIYHAAVDRIRALVDAGELGELFYLYAARVNLGRLRTDENALWSFAPHDVSMIDSLLGELPVSVAARGQAYLQPDIEDVVFVTMKFAGGQMAHVHLSWLDPHKERKLTVVGSQKMVVFDDVSPEKLRIYDKGYDRPPEFTQFDEYLTLRQGDVHIPYLSMQEPLAVECRHFLDCIRSGEEPRTGATSALRVVQVLAAAQRSLELDGVPITLSAEL